MKSVLLNSKLLAIIMLLTGFSASAYDFKSGELYYDILSEIDCTVSVTSKSQGENYVSGDIEIPQKFIYKSKTYTVTSIENCAFYDCSNLTSVMIPNSVTSIGAGAFSGCSKLENIDVDPENSDYSSIDGILYNKDATILLSCPGRRTSVTIPDSVTSIGSAAFYECSSLTSVTIPNSVTSIGSAAFYECSHLSTIYMQCEVPIKCGSIFSDASYVNAVLYVPKGTKAAYEKVDPWRKFWNIEEGDYNDVDVIEADNNGTLRISVNNGTVTINGIGSHESVSVYDMQGRTVYNGTSHTIDNLQSGLYIVKAKNWTVKISI